MPPKMNQFDATKGGKKPPATNQKEDKPSKRSFGKNVKQQAEKPAG
jgi:hypothetical protein